MQWNSDDNQFSKKAGNSQSQTNPGTVQVLSPDERENFNGITIEQDNGNPKSARIESPFQKVFVFQSSGGPLSKLIISTLLLLAGMFFLPLTILIIATLGLNWLSNRSKE